MKTVGFDGERGRGVGRRDRPQRRDRDEQPRRPGRPHADGLVQRRAPHASPCAGEVIGTAAERDLAIIRVQLNDLVPVPLGRSSKLRLGDGVLAIGFPLGLAGGPTVTQGIVSGLDRTVHAGRRARPRGTAPDRRGDQSRQLGRRARRRGRQADRHQHRRRARQRRERRLRDRDRRGPPRDRRDPQQAGRPARVDRRHVRLDRHRRGRGPARPRARHARSGRDRRLRRQPRLQGGPARGRCRRLDRRPAGALDRGDLEGAAGPQARATRSCSTSSTSRARGASP